MSQCALSDELRKLKESSKEAIEGIEEFSKFKEYMHIERVVEKELKAKIESAYNRKGKKLIMVCGSVGDGKSHIISMLRSKLKYIDETFFIHNDATESHIPSKTFKEVLDDKLDEFSDDRIDEYSNYKLILAINLGTLNNFIEDKRYSKKYKKLKKYVYENKIIEDDIVDYFEDENFEYINFSDFSMFELTEIGPESSFIKNLMLKIFDDNVDNPFNNKFKNICNNNCIYSEWCPSKLNFEFMKDEVVRNAIINGIIEIQIKHKVIISVRTLLNFIYDLIISSDFEKDNELNLLTEIHKLANKPDEFLSFLTPSILYSHKEKSAIFTAFYKIDPFDVRTEVTDNIFIQLNTLENYNEIFDKYIDKNRILNISKKLIELYSNSQNKTNSVVFSKFFIRLSSLIKNELCEEKKLYNKFMIDLYNFNTNNMVKLKQIYNDTKNSILIWNGKTDDGSINLFIGQKQRDYLLSQEINMGPKPPANTIVEESIINKFTTNIRLDYQIQNTRGKSEVSLYIDFALYHLLARVREGYKPNKKDKENFITFINSIKKIQEYGNKHEKIKVKEKNVDGYQNYVLSDDGFGGYIFEKVN